MSAAKPGSSWPSRESRELWRFLRSLHEMHQSPRAIAADRIGDARQKSRQAQRLEHVLSIRRVACVRADTQREAGIEHRARRRDAGTNAQIAHRVVDDSRVRQRQPRNVFGVDQVP